jgi:hypothetical protein
MSHAIMRSRFFVHLWKCACSAGLLATVACGAGQSAGPSTPADVAGDSPAPLDTLTSDSLASVDSLTSDSMGAAIPSTLLSYSSVPYGPYHLMNSYTTYAWGPAPFTTSLNGNTGAGGVIRQIDAARLAKQKLMLSLTDGYRTHYLTGGKFDMAKWKARMNAYNTTAIKAAVARGVSDGTILGDQVINEPNVSGWGGNINKAVVDQMCS